MVHCETPKDHHSTYYAVGGHFQELVCSYMDLLKCLARLKPFECCVEFVPCLHKMDGAPQNIHRNPHRGAIPQPDQFI